MPVAAIFLYCVMPFASRSFKFTAIAPVNIPDVSQFCAMQFMWGGYSCRKGVDCTIHSKILEPLGRYVILKAEINGKMYVLINVYAPNKDTNITQILITFAIFHVIILFPCYFSYFC